MIEQFAIVVETKIIFNNMSDYSVSMGCGDYPTNDLSESHSSGGYAETEEEVREHLRRGFIKDFCPGEKFGPFSEDGRRMVAAFPELNKDRDWARMNDGITVILFK